jgi:predicted AlkP superfamily pyrophosphatase or phosphodiesterase
MSGGPAQALTAMRRARLPVVLGAALLFLPAGARAQDTEPSRTPKVLLIGIDGVRPDVLADVDTPSIDRLIAEGAFTDAARTGFPTVSGPGWSSFLTGVWPEKHGVKDNEFQGKNYHDFPDLFTRIETVRPELETWVAADWLPLVAEDHNGPVISDAVDTKHVLDGYSLGWAEADERTVLLAEAALSEQDPDAMFVYLGNPDETSHHFNSIGKEYRDAIILADRHVGRLVAALNARPTVAAEDWLILVSTDHGRTDEGGHGGDSPEERTIFYLASGPSVVPGRPSGAVHIVDVAVTALVHLGIHIDPGWDLDGRVVGIPGPGD